MQSTIDGVSKSDFDRNGIVRIPFESATIKEKREEIIKEFEKSGFVGELTIGGAFDGNCNAFVLHDLERIDSAEALDWIIKNAHETGV